MSAGVSMVWPLWTAAQEHRAPLAILSGLWPWLAGAAWRLAGLSVAAGALVPERRA